MKKLTRTRSRSIDLRRSEATPWQPMPEATQRTVRLSQPNGVDLVAADEAVLPQAVGLHADHRARSLGIEADCGENDQASTRKPREDAAAEMIGHGAFGARYLSSFSICLTSAHATSEYGVPRSKPGRMNLVAAFCFR